MMVPLLLLASTSANPSPFIFLSPGAMCFRMSFGGSYGAYVARCKRGGYAGGPRRAAFWRSLGFPNLVRARAAKARKREARLRKEILEKARRITPFAMPEDVPQWAEVLGIPYRRNQRPRGF